MANLKHGRFSHAAIAARRQLRERMRTIRELLKEMRA
jgi:hypothetical protein